MQRNEELLSTLLHSAARDIDKDSTIFGRGQDPVAVEEAAALPVDSVSPAGSSGAAAPEGNGPSD